MRNKLPLPDFYEILDAGLRYSDDDFTPDQSALTWTDMGEKGKNELDNKNVSWKRIYD